jgi:hypothetical protein
VFFVEQPPAKVLIPPKVATAILGFHIRRKTNKPQIIEEKFLKGFTDKAAQVSRIHAYVEDLEGQEAWIQVLGAGQRVLLWQCLLRDNAYQRDYLLGSE